jgi:hypothetical protein
MNAFPRSTCRQSDEYDTCTKVRDGVYTIKGRPGWDFEGWEFVVRDLSLPYTSYHSSGQYLVDRALEEGLDPVAKEDLFTALQAKIYRDDKMLAALLVRFLDPDISAKEVARDFGLSYGGLRTECNRVRLRVAMCNTGSDEVV